MKNERIYLNTISQAYFDTYLLENSPEIDPSRKRPLIIICPGGGYAMTSDREAEAVAVEMLHLGFHAVVLRYSVAPVVFPTSLVELAETMKIIRENKEPWQIDEEKIIVAGFSAGGHLAASLGVFWSTEWLSKKVETNPKNIQPNGLLLAYPVLTSGVFGHQDSFKNLLGKDYEEKKDNVSLEQFVDSSTPQTFMWHTAEDDLVQVENSLMFAQALRKNKILFDLHVFSKGGHGLSLGTVETAISNGYGVQKEVSVWPVLFKNWLDGNF